MDFIQMVQGISSGLHRINGQGFTQIRGFLYQLSNYHHFNKD
jgi:hypothetical protein